ncbi:bacteriocin [Enterococcus faecalis]|uniref:bacteriocin n=1 Tax=Enterococcus faecalis TaxID=1351 RepID=UPI001F58C403|nr:bacteriocin [Enterococcus faecalis]
MKNSIFKEISDEKLEKIVGGGYSKLQLQLARASKGTGISSAYAAYTFSPRFHNPG